MPIEQTGRTGLIRGWTLNQATDRNDNTGRMPWAEASGAQGADVRALLPGYVAIRTGGPVSTEGRSGIHCIRGVRVVNVEDQVIGRIGGRAGEPQATEGSLVRFPSNRYEPLA